MTRLANYIQTLSRLLQLEFLVVEGSHRSWSRASWIDHMDSGEDEAIGLEARCDEGAQVDRDQFSDGMQENGEESHEWGEAPDGIEGDCSKSAAPLQRDANATQVGA